MSLTAKRPWLPYVAPMALYLAFLQAQASWPDLLELWYPAKTIAVTALLWMFRRHYTELVPKFSALAVAVGLVAIIIWIAIDPFYPKLGELIHLIEDFGRNLSGMEPAKRVAEPVFDPTGKWAFIGFRVVGAVLVVPVMEELFWRGFLIRWLVDEDFKRVPPGTFTWFSFGATVFLFGVEHSQWLAGLICGALYNWLFYRTRSVTACVIAHAVSNAVLAGYVLATGDWKFW